MRMPLNLVLFVLCVACAFGKAEQVKFTKIVEPHLVTVDRRPKPQLVYSLCLGIFETSDEWQYIAAAEAGESRTCPEPSRVEADMVKVPGQGKRITTTSEAGKTVTESYKEKNPVREVRVNTTKFTLLSALHKISRLDTDGKVLDTIYTAQINEETPTTKSTRFIVCKDGSNLETCFKTPIDITPASKTVSTYRPHAQPENAIAQLPPAALDHETNSESSNGLGRPINQDVPTL